jgi:CBS domain containing-hemolysin-like protein
VVSGNLEIKKFNRIFQAHLKDPFNETLAGFIISRMDKIPQAMENFRWDDFSFLILRATPQKILEIQVSKIIPVDSGKKFFS